MQKSWVGVAGLVSVLPLFTACSLPSFATWHPTPFKREASPKAAALKVPNDSEVGEIGVASWYGPGFNGRPTSSGEIYDQNDLTCAHPDLPLGTRVLVTNLENGRSVELRVNDRGPFVDGRVIDLSYGAARVLDTVDPGLAEVSIEPLSKDGQPIGRVAYSVQAGAFQDIASAAALRDALASERQEVYVSLSGAPDSPVYRVRIGPYPDRDQALAEASDLGRVGLPVLIVEEVLR